MNDITVSELKQVLYVDRAYEALQHLGRRESQPTVDLRMSELRVFSQNGEDGVLDALIRLLEPAEFFVEFGVGDGWSCNCRLLAEVREWSGLMIESNPEDFERLRTRYRFTSRVRCAQDFVTPANINELFRMNEVPRNLGVLSMDTDGQDYWIWRQLTDEYRPRIVVVEFNAEHGPVERRVEVQSERPAGPLGRVWGASFGALVDLAAEKDYELVHVEMANVNLFFVERSALLAVGRERIAGRGRPGAPNYGLRGLGLSDTVAYPGGDVRDRTTVRP